MIYLQTHKIPILVIVNIFMRRYLTISLKELKLQFGHVINEMTKTTQLGLFSFRAVLNIGMFLTESEKAKQVRARILDIVIATINFRAGVGTKYVNKRAVTPDESDRFIGDGSINFGNILEANREVLKRLKQA